MERPDDFDFQFHRLIHGDLPVTYCLQIGTLPEDVASPLGWPVVPVFLCGSDVQKLRFHGKHPMEAANARLVLKTIEDGDYYQHRGGPMQIEAVYHTPNREREIHFAALALDVGRKAIYLRTFYRSTNTSHSKFLKGTRLRWVSGSSYFRVEA